MHLLAAQGDADRVVDGQDESFISLTPCNEMGVSKDILDARGEYLQYLMTAMLTGAVQVMMEELVVAMVAPPLL